MKYDTVITAHIAACQSNATHCLSCVFRCKAVDKHQLSEQAADIFKIENLKNADTCPLENTV